MNAPWSQSLPVRVTNKPTSVCQREEMNAVDRMGERDGQKVLKDALHLESEEKMRLIETYQEGEKELNILRKKVTGFK